MLTGDNHNFKRMFVVFFKNQNAAIAIVVPGWKISGNAFLSKIYYFQTSICRIICI